jgi:DNA-binding SARP family transcriptional activator
VPELGLEADPGVPSVQPSVAVPLPPVVPERAAGLTIRCFGRFEVERDGKPVENWRRGKARTLLKFLVTQRHPVPRDVLIELLWPQYDVEPARNSLRVTLHALRQALGSFSQGRGSEREYVDFVDGSFLLNSDCRSWIDVEEFETHFEAAVRLERQQCFVEAVRAYEQAEAIYRDDYLVEDLYEDWALARRERLKDQYLLLVTKLADYSLQHGDAFGCIVRCHKILQKDACREDAYFRLMRCYVDLGQRSQALHWYDICARTLRKELDISPSDTTNCLYAQIATRRRQPLQHVRPDGAGT